MGLENKSRCVSIQEELSGGQEAAVANTRTLAMDPKVLFFCLMEATSALDPEMVVEEVFENHDRQLCGKWHDYGSKVTHEMGFCQDVGDRVVLWMEGYIVEEGNPKDV